MVEQKRNIPKKNVTSDDSVQPDMKQPFAGNPQIDGSFQPYHEMPYNEYYRENIPENYHFNEQYQQDYRYNFPRIQYEYEQKESFDKEGSSSEEEHKIKKTGRKKIMMEYIEGKNKRSVTFSKRKKGIMKKAYELNVLTGTQILLLVASESGHVYTFATPKLKPIISNHERLIQQCLNAPSTPPERSAAPTFKYSKDDDKKDQYFDGYNNGYFGGYDNPEN